MKFRENANSPIIVTGMHRSGTSLLSKLLQDAGVFMGQPLEANQESTFFLRFNGWVFKQLGCSWDNVYNYKFADQNFFDHIKKVYLNHTKSILSIKYLGLSKYVKYKGLNNIDITWGWKDPRNSITLNFWKQVYPSAKIIHIYRNPLDVAMSLKTRSEKSQASYKSSFTSKLRESSLAGRVGYCNSYRVLSIEEGYNLWRDYVGFCLEENDSLHIGYESLSQSPVSNLKRIFDYIDISLSEKSLRELSAQINSKKSFGFVSDESAAKFYQTVKNDTLMKELGYSDIEVAS